ncbi:MAG: MoaD/ThiS family protein, partial [Methanosarcina mazei]|nr:MoaD/ThiS family protein [Methanosarcina mazei]
MKINVKFLASIREIAGAHEMQFELNSGYTVKDLLEFLELRFG